MIELANGSSWALLFASPAVLDLLDACAEHGFDDALRKRLVRRKSDRADRGIVRVEQVGQRAQSRTAPDEQRGMTLWPPGNPPADGRAA